MLIIAILFLMVVGIQRFVVDIQRLELADFTVRSFYIIAVQCCRKYRLHNKVCHAMAAN